jgi:predicted acylesterase/phospholipase RssA
MDKNSINENSINENSINENSINENSINENLINENSINENSINENSINENLINENLINENPINENPINENPINENSINENSINENPINENPINENPIKENPIKENPINKIKNIVLSGGGIFGLTMYSILRESEKDGFWNIKNIKNIYATSVGTIVAIIISLNIDWDMNDDYLIHRPWQNLFSFNMFSILESFNKGGIYNKDVIVSMLNPLFKAMDISIDICMKDYYELSGIEFHFYTNEINEMKIIDLSWKTHPDWLLIDAIYASCCLPVFFTAFQLNGILYTDGGLGNNYPIFDCIKDNPDISETFGICINNQFDKKIKNNSNLFDYIFFILKKLLEQYDVRKPLCQPIPNEIRISMNDNFFYDIYVVVASIDKRKELMEEGTKLWQLFKKNNPLK